MNNRVDNFARLGRWSLLRLSLVSDILILLAQAFKNFLSALRHGNAAVRKVLFKQIYFTGLEASAIIVTIAVMLGAVIITQVVSLVGNNGSLTGKILVWVVLRELAPLLTAIIVIARSGTAIAAELGSMKINGEIDALEMLGIPSDRYLILPRILGVTLSVIILTFYFVLSSFVGSFLIASFGWHIPYQQFVQGIMLSLGASEVIMLFSKSLIFGLFVSATCCCYGLSVGRSATEIPQAATKAVMTSLFAVFFLDGLITYLASISFS
jgi:phospholipid/cholesterol/gamma-HCH transport system permease protein